MSGEDNSKLKDPAVIFPIIISMLALAISILAVIIPGQPILSFHGCNTFNQSLNSTPSELCIYNKIDSRPIVGDFYADSIPYINMTYYDSKESKNYQLYIPLSNYHENFVTSNEQSGFIANFTIVNLTCKNNDKFEDLANQFKNYSSFRGDVGKLDILEYVHAHYRGQFIPEDKYYIIDTSTHEIPSNFFKFAHVYDTPIDVCLSNADDTAFTNWVNASKKMQDINFLNDNYTW
jgi:hypothetical protein